ncbi:hypothetical protein BD779DRAFT_1801006 [Infundibulicybe gibba]|nr:hypothetical protein BD779DRAFT_1801006 [Infundibulicybe gibba]
MNPVCLTSFHAIAALSTIFRLHRRISTRRWWWDDTIACPALIIDCVYLSSLWVLPALPQVQPMRTWAMWFASLPFVFLLGFTRASLALSLARIFPPWQTTHRIIIYMTIGIALAYSALVIITGVYCGLPNEITSLKSLHRIVLATMCVDIISDSFIIAIPLITLWNIKLPRNQRRLLLAGFSSGIGTTAISVAGAVIMFRYPIPLLGVIMPHLEATVSLLSCNFLVIVTMIYRVLQRVDDLEDPSCDSEYTSESTQISTGVQLSSSLVPTTIILTDPSDLVLDEHSHGSIGHFTSSAVNSFPGRSLGVPA